ncbi:MAG: DNA adenine methylase [Myxococcota bacterium]|nr:DNA adenine methylase [Myxococcota bacterium]
MPTSAAIARIPLARRATALRGHPSAPLRDPSPFIKWVGGKGKLLAQLLPMLPPGAELMRHVEPFAGGGAMFFARRPSRALLCDVNPALTDLYLAVRDDVDAVIAALEPLVAEHALEAGSYYRVRERYNAGRIAPSKTRARASGTQRAARAAMFIYLNKTCFNGLHRVNRKGEFNVPEGRYKNPRILDVEGLRAASAALSRCEIQNVGFEGLLASAKPGDFVYLDPPYEPMSRTASFTSYAEEGFSQDDQRRLRDVYAELDRRGCKLMLSNSDVPFIRDLYARWRIDVVAAARAVSCDARGRGLVSEVVVRNY